MTRPTQRPAPGQADEYTWRAIGVPEGYISGLGRDVPHPRVAHLYRGTFDEPGMAMCPRGYNRGVGYSIWRNNVGVRGICKRCMRRAQSGLPPIPWPDAAKPPMPGEE